MLMLCAGNLSGNLRLSIYLNGTFVLPHVWPDGTISPCSTGIAVAPIPQDMGIEWRKQAVIDMYLFFLSG